MASCLSETNTSHNFYCSHHPAGLAIAGMVGGDVTCYEMNVANPIPVRRLPATRITTSGRQRNCSGKDDCQKTRLWYVHLSWLYIFTFLTRSRTRLVLFGNRAVRSFWIRSLWPRGSLLPLLGRRTPWPSSSPPASPLSLFSGVWAANTMET